MVRFFMKSKQKSTTMMNPSSSSSAFLRDNQMCGEGSSGSSSVMDVENDVRKNPVLQYPQLRENVESDAESEREFNERLKLKIKSRSRRPTSDLSCLFAKAIKENNLSKIIHLIRVRRQSPDVADSRARTPLHLAVAAGHYMICEYLLQNGSNPNAKDQIGNTPLHLAALSTKVDIVNLLLENGAKCDILDNSGFSPLALAASKLKLLSTSLRGNPNANTLIELKNKCDDIVAMLDLCFCSNNFDNLNLTEFKAVVQKKKVAIASVANNDLEQDVNDLLSSIQSLNLDTHPK